MIEHLLLVLHNSPALCLFLSILFGTIIGRFHVGAVGLGSVIGTLVAGMVIGIVAEPELPDVLRWSFFYLFLFSIGYSVGPQFFNSLNRSVLPQIGLAVVVALSALAAVIAVSVAFGFDEGLAVGVLSGGMTHSAALGTGLSAIGELPLSEASKAALIANAPLADAITYLFGDLALILFLTWIGPAIMRADLKHEARVLKKQWSSGDIEGLSTATYYGTRAYRIENASLSCPTIGALEQQYADARLSVQRVQRGADVLELHPELVLNHGDRLVVSAQLRAFPQVQHDIGPEIDDPTLLAVPSMSAAIVVTQAAVKGRTIGDLARDPRFRGVYLESVRRGAEAVPRESWTQLDRGDILHVVGAPDDVDRAGRHIGFVERDLSKTDLTFLAGGICAGMLLGMIAINFGQVELGLGTAGSILVIGLAGGWARSRYPVFGAIPEPAQRLLMDIGLIVFVAVIGLHAGPHAVAAYRDSGGAFFAKVFAAGMIVTTVPLAVGTFFARSVLKLSPLVALGGLAGSRTSPSGLTALREASDSDVASLVYTVPYAIAYVLLTMWGPVVVAIVHAMRS